MKNISAKYYVLREVTCFLIDRLMRNDDEEVRKEASKLAKTFKKRALALKEQMEES